MRIGIDITWMGAAPAGVGTMTADVIRELGGRQDVELILFCREEQSVDAFGARATRVAIPSSNRHWRMYKAVQDTRLDLLWQTGGWLPLLLPRGLNTVQTVHDLLSFAHPEWFPQTGLSRWWSHTIRVPHALGQAGVIHAISSYTAAQITERFPHVSDRVMVAYQGVQAPDTIDSYAHARPYILMLGTIEPRKNLQGAAEAFAAFASEHEGVDLIIAGGDGWRMQESKEAIGRLQERFPDRVHRLAYVDEATKWSLIVSARALLVTSHAEGFGRPVVEAMAVGTPAIVPDHSALREVGTDAAIMTPPGNVQKIARAIWRASFHEVLRERLIPLGRTRAEQFKTAEMVDAVLEQGLQGDNQ